MWLKKYELKTLPWKWIAFILSRDKGWDSEQIQFSFGSLKLQGHKTSSLKSFHDSIDMYIRRNFQVFL